MKDLFLKLSFILLAQALNLVLISGQVPLLQQVRTLELRELTNKKYSDIEGSPYYTDEFIISRVYLKSGNYSTIPLRYDLFQDQMEFKKDQTVLWVVKKDIKYIRYGNEMIFVSSPDGDTSKLGYFFLKDNGKYLLFYKRIVNYLPLVPAKGYSDIKPDRFDHPYDEIFIKEGDNPARKIKTKKELLAFFKNEKTALDFIEKEKIKPDNIEDLHKLVSFLNGF
jgi:hypothetical protein